VKKRVRQTKSGTAISPALLAAALRAQGDGVVISRMVRGPEKFRIVFANENFCEMTGHSFAELAAHSPGSLHVEKGDLTRLDRWRRNAKPGRSFSGEGYLLRKDGSVLYAAWTFSAIPERGGRVTHLIATYRDTTQKRRLQEALVHSQRLDAVGRLAGGVAHDFNNLLSVINGYCEMLAAHLSEMPQALREVNEIHRAGQRAATLTRQLLAFGRRQPMNARVINLNRVVHDNAEILARLIGSSGRLDLDLTKDLSNVRADPTQFQQVILNLVINARDALRDSGTITISTDNREIRPGSAPRSADVRPGRYVALSVTDNGTGMDAETQKHLFEPFFTTKPEGKGTGLGLALVYGVVQQNNGYITVRSALLAGSTFEILLPAVEEPEEASMQTAPISPLPATRGHETLLLVEEDEVVRKMVAGMLTADGYRVMACKTAKDGIELSGRHDRPVQLLIAGFDEDGEKLARSLYSSVPALRVIWVGTHETLSPAAWLPPAQQYTLAKPFALSEVLRNVRALLDA
jgi:PAS domain S-box-containing protein